MIADRLRGDVPHSIDAEQSVLGSLWWDNSAWDRVGDILESKHFFDHRHGLIFGVLSSLLNACKQADMVSVFEELSKAGKAEDVGGLEYLQAIHACSFSSSNIRRHAEIVREKYQHRALLETADKACELAAEPTDVSEKTDRIATMFADLQQGQVRKMPRPASDLICERVDHWNALHQGEIAAGISTGIRAIDDALNGGLRGGKVYVLAARPSVGKSSLAQAIALHTAADGHPSLLLSQEMDAAECMDRATAKVGGIDYEHLQTGAITDFEWPLISEAVERLGRLPFFVDDQSSLTLAEIRAKAVALRRQGLKVLVLDYLQLCASSGRAQNRNSEIEEISRGLKKLAKDLDLAVILLSQLNRDVERRASPRPTLADLRDSGAIEQDADVVLMLYQVRQFTDRRIMGLLFAKNRQGKFKGDLALEFQGQYQRWYGSDADITPQRASASHTGGFDQ